MKYKCHELNAAGFQIQLIQTGFDAFTVVFGLQVKHGLTYVEAAAAYGACLMHALACEGRLDNRTRAEARKVGERTPQFSAPEV